MISKDYLSELQALFPAGGVETTGPYRFWISLDTDGLIPAVKALRETLGITHLSTIAAEDMRDHLLANYIFAGEVVVVLKVRIDREKAEVPTLAFEIPGAMVYERELKDILGITPIGHPDLRRQAVPEDWPEGVYPLRKDAVIPGREEN